ncbi:MAG: tetratricopeptide repeat protein [Chlorobiaceae bacterium]|nr:tetratricopeptide repeat protein [Chlorobiaceae bacterium]
MKHLRLLAFPGFLCIILSLFSCSNRKGGPDAAPWYQKAAHLERQKHYAEALEAYDKALAADTLNGFSRVTLEALCRISRIEFMTGRYSGAFRTCGIIERHAGVGLADSLHTAVVLDTARMYAELGLYGKAASIMASLRTSDPWHRYEQATLLFRSGDVDGASHLYGDLSLSEDPSIRMVAFAGLLDCSLAQPGSVPDTPERCAAKIAAVSARVMQMTAPPEQKIRALRIAARTLQQLEKQKPDASFLLFRALSMAQSAGLTRLVPILQYESNAVLVNKPDTYRSVIEYFGQKNMIYAKAAALCKLGQSPELKPAERISALRSGLDACQYYGIPATAEGYTRVIREAVCKLEDILIAEGRYTELFDLGAQAELLSLRSRLQSNISAFQLPAGHESLRNEIVGLSSEIAGLLQRNLSMFEEGTDYRLGALADQAIGQKQGRLIELIAEASKIDETVPLKLQPEPLTLRSIQNHLQPEQALVRFYLRDSLSTVMLLSKTEMQIVTSSLSAEQVKAGFADLKQRLASGDRAQVAGADFDSQRLWLTDSLLKSMSDRLATYRHIIFVSGQPEPFHLLGRRTGYGRERKVSWLVSSNEVCVQPGKRARGKSVFFDADRPEKAQIHKRFHPNDQVFLTWKPLSREEVDRLNTAMKKNSASPDSASGIRNFPFPDSAGEQSRLWLGWYGSD